MSYFKTTTELAHMTMTKEIPTTHSADAFWLTHPDPTQASVHLALQWLAFVYPASELQIDLTLKSALPYADTDLSARWGEFLETREVEEHVDALRWISETLSIEQIPFLVETCWRLLLVDHELPTHVPLALRIMGQVLNIEESRVHDIGEEVYSEFSDIGGEKTRAPLLPVDPRYLDRVEWRLTGHSSFKRRASDRRRKDDVKRNSSSLVGFVCGAFFGALVVVGLVFGPFQMGRITVSRIMPAGEGNFGTVPTVSLASESEDDEAELQSNANVTALEVIGSTIAEPIAVEPIEAAAAVEPAGAVTDAEQTQPTATPSVAAPDDVVPDDTAPDVVVPDVVEASATPALIGGRVLMEVTASILNVRREARVDSEVLIKLATGARVWAYPESSVGLWMLVQVQGERGYVSARFLSEVP